MAKAALLYVGTSGGLCILSDPGGTGRWRQAGETLQGQRVSRILTADALTLAVVVDGVILYSSDGAQSWAPAREADRAELGELATSNEVLVTTAQGPSRRTVPLPAPDPLAIAVLGGKQEVFLATVVPGTRILRSEDSGTTWNPATLQGDLRGAVQSLAPAAYHMDQIWAGTDQGQILYSNDRGRTWHEVQLLEQAILSLAAVRLI